MEENLLVDVTHTMDQSGIDKAVVFTIDGFFYDPFTCNNLLNEQVRSQMDA